MNLSEIRPRLRRFTFAHSIRVLLSVVLLLGGCSPESSLQERIRRLRQGIGTPATAENYLEQLQTLEQWCDDLSSRGSLRIPTIVVIPLEQMRNDGRFTEQTPAMIAGVARTLAFISDHGDRVGTLERIDDSDLVANEFATLVLEYRVGEVEIGPGGSLRIGQIFSANTLQPLQTVDPTADAYVSFEVEGAARTEAGSVPWQGVFNALFGAAPAPALQVQEGSLRRGDTVRIYLGDRRKGSRGLRMTPRDADDFRFVLQMDPDGSGLWVPADFVSVRIRGGAAAGLRAVVPSIVEIGEGFALRLAVEDVFFSPARFEGGRFDVFRSGSQQEGQGARVGTVTIPEGRSEGRLDGLQIDGAGGFRFEVVGVGNALRTWSNPMLVQERPLQRIYWGELHGHSGLEDGTGSVVRYFEYARDVAFLDFGSLTGHDVTLTPPGWEHIRTETERANRDGSFVAFMGYEWTVEYVNGGHNNVFFRQDPGRYVTIRDTVDKPALHRRLKEMHGAENVLVIPHAHNPGNWSTPGDGSVERLVEMYSIHGSFEYFGQRYLDRGCRVGLVAASDDHTGHPGNAPAAISTRGGLAAVYAPRLERDAIWSGLRNRATYGTSGKRPVVQVSVDGHLVGEPLPAGSVPTFQLRVLGTAPIDHVDFIKNGAVEYTQAFVHPGSEPSTLQIMFHSRSEPEGDAVQPPLRGVTWQGWIEIDRGSIQAIEPMGVDHFTDQFHRVNERTLWFSCKTRGDFDGLYLSLKEASLDTEVSIRITGDMGRDATGGATRGLFAPERPPSREPVHDLRLRLAELAGGKTRHPVTPGAEVLARLASPEGPWDVAFDYRPTTPPVQDDYFYLRVVQVDGETVWTSPIWIGEENPPAGQR